MRLIDADALKGDFREWLSENSDYRTILQIIDGAPTIEAEPVRHGRWIEIGADKRGRGGIQKCTACNGIYPYKCKRCPNCGAMMDAKEENET